MATQTIPLVSVQEYLKTAYEPDCDYVDGVVEERNLGEYEHGKVQGVLIRILGNHEVEWGIDVVPECRMQISSSRFRIPDILAMRRGQTVQRIVHEAPLLCIEVLSPEDTWKRLKGRLDDYLAFGVKHIWVIDPDDREVYTYDVSGYHKVTVPELTVEGTPIRVAVAEVFAVLA
jgi:Uma2 family endonuclease